MKLCNAITLGLINYDDALTIQKELVELLKERRAEVADRADEEGYLLLLEHPPIVTMGRSGSDENLLVPLEELQSRGVTYAEVSRGGDVTYHGPGQLVGYPIIHVDLHGKDVHRFLRMVEQVIIDLLDRYGIHSHRDSEYTGVWVGNDKIAAIGVAVTKWISYHGFALNVNPNMDHFDLIRPCGIEQRGITSMTKILNETPCWKTLCQQAAECFAEVFNFDELLMTEEAPSELHVQA